MPLYRKKANDGKDGESSYGIALRLGFQGTESQWLASLKGEPGQDGENFNLSVNTLEANLEVNANSYSQRALNIGNGFALSKVATNISNIRVRLYLNQSFASADINRAVNSILPTSHGLIYDAVFSNTLSLDVLPSAIAFPLEACILVINNLSGTQQNIILNLNYIPLI